ncbi:MAG: helix-hairpin-helix domain-containing protein [Thermovirgaceae bacterium]
MKDLVKLKGLLFLIGGFLSLAAASVLVLSFTGRWGGDEPKHVAGPALHLTREEIPRETESTPSPKKESLEGHWVLYITGAVRRPGVYKLPPDSRVYELVKQAGGLTDSAAPEAFNMAAPLEDGMHIHVPDKTEAVPPAFDHSTQGAGLPGAVAFGGSRRGYGLIDINTADAKTLEGLTGIGPKTAEAIIRHREQEGPFRCVDDLLSVKGIGPAKLKAIRDQVQAGR